MPSGFKWWIISTKGLPAPIGGNCRWSPTKIKRFTPFKQSNVVASISSVSIEASSSITVSYWPSQYWSENTYCCISPLYRPKPERNWAIVLAVTCRFLATSSILTLALPVGAKSNTPLFSTSFWPAKIVNKVVLPVPAGPINTENLLSAISFSAAAFSFLAFISWSSGVPLVNGFKASSSKTVQLAVSGKRLLFTRSFIFWLIISFVFWRRCNW